MVAGCFFSSSLTGPWKPGHPPKLSCLLGSAASLHLLLPSPLMGCTSLLEEPGNYIFARGFWRGSCSRAALGAAQPLWYPKHPCHPNWRCRHPPESISTACRGDSAAARVTHVATEEMEINSCSGDDKLPFRAALIRADKKQD